MSDRPFAETKKSVNRGCARSGQSGCAPREGWPTLAGSSAGVNPLRPGFEPPVWLAGGGRRVLACRHENHLGG